ncbi:hypothetical protein GCM10007383_10880 [Arenibacter certesii]|uniref:Uncharacterized protein n=2 Tax=Arenibacter certesii TaxID=228955 RepID=A0A918ITH4_9FLAO|nr:hypothetical protein GCM10007383_10880 [Arenibacter certesii]
MASCDTLLEQDETDFGQGPILVQFEKTKTELNIIKDPENTPIDYEVPITFFGGKNVPLDRDVDVTIATSPDSEANEGEEFELNLTTYTIPAGETSVIASIKILTEKLVPFEFKNIVLEITNSSESVSDVNSTAITLKALDSNTLAGTYTVEVGKYWNSGNYNSSFPGRTFVIAAIAPGLYRHEGIAFWPDGNDFYFTVDEETGVISVLDKDPDRTPTLLNGSPIMNCAGGQFEMAPCTDETKKATLKDDGHHLVELTTGYFRGAGATRESLQKLVRL